MEQALSAQQLDLSRYDMLPKIAANAGYSHRSNDEGSNSKSLIDGTQSLVASTSRDRNTRTADISIMWNVLDFGVSYARAKQQADRVLIIEERRRKVIQNILQDVRYAYWRAVSSERLIQDMFGLLNQTKLALKHSRLIAEERLQSPKESLEYQKALLENIRLLWSIIQNLTPAKVELAALMNLPPGIHYKLTEEDWSFPEVPMFTAPLPDLEKMALIYRPELREEDYRARISTIEIRKALLAMLPGLNLTISPHYDSTEYLYNQSWWDAGAAISQNIVKLYSGPKSIKAAKAQVGVDNLRRQAVSMAILVQVNLAYQRYGLAKKEYIVSRHLDNISNQLNTQIEAEKKAGTANELDQIKSMTNVLIAKMRHYNAYAELQNSAGRIFNTLGTDIIPAEIESTDVAPLASAIQQSIESWQQQLNPAPGPENSPEPVIGGLPESSFDLSDIAQPEEVDSRDMFRSSVFHTSPQDVSVKDLLEDTVDFSRPSKEAQKLSDLSKTRVIVRDSKVQDDSKHTEEVDMEPFKISLRSAADTTDILRQRLLNDAEDGPVRVQVKSTGLQQTPAWFRRDTIIPTEDPGVKIRISSPLSVRTFN
jgi:outer membrane protein TolC